jgi:ABC-type nitrate/sulfonate/bicarbonate transport system permease component
VKVRTAPSTTADRAPISNGAGELSTSVFRKPVSARVQPESVRGNQRTSIDRLIAIMVPVVIIGAWQLAVNLGLAGTQFFPTPGSIWRTFISLVENDTLQKAIVYSFKNVLLGFIYGSVGGFVLGMLLGTARRTRMAMESLIYGLYTVPKLALLPLLLLIFGLGAAPQIALIAMSVFFLVLIPVIAAFTSVPLSYRETGRSFGASRFQMMRHVLLPAALPATFVSLRVASGAAVLVMVAAEYVDGSQGLGYLIWNSWSLFLVKEMYVGIIVVSILGVIFTRIVVEIGRRISPWAEEH